MKIIFLDIDGVLNSISYFKSINDIDDPDDRLDPVAVALLNKIIQATNAKIVISSSWRLGKSITQLQDVFNKHSIIGTIVGLTPDDYNTRGVQIQQWINDCDFTIDSFIILDDDNDMCHLNKHLVKTSVKDGLTIDCVHLAISKLLGDTNIVSNTQID